MKLHEKMRVEDASRLLLNSDLNVGEVANACGFSDPYNFSRTFTKIAGVPPSVFKRKIKNG
jgi:transcriptional regulator GlxA family with amidase domain